MFVKLSSGAVINVELITAMTPGSLLIHGRDFTISAEDREMLLELLIPKAKVSLESLRPEQVPAPPESTVPQGSYRRDRGKAQPKQAGAPLAPCGRETPAVLEKPNSERSAKVEEQG